MSTAAPSSSRSGDVQVFEKQTIGLPPLRDYVRQAWQRRDFAVELARTKLRAQHFDTVFGRLWLVLNPLLLAAVYYALVDILRGGASQRPGFFAHIVIGIFGYYYASGPLRDGVRSVTGAGRLILNQPFPRVLLPLSSVVMAFKRFIPALIVYLPIHLLSGLPVTLGTVFWVLAVFTVMTVLGFGLAMFAAALQVYFRDLANFLPYGLRIGLYASPILYYADNVPGGYDWLLYINPFGMVIAAWGSAWESGTVVGLQFAVACGWAVVAFVLGALYFLRREREFAVRL